MSLIQVSIEMDAAERAFSIGSRIAETIHAGSSSDHPTESRHVNAVANELMRMLEGESNENPEEESQSDSDEMMETESQRRLRCFNSEMCERSDPEEWMVYHHGESESSSGCS